MPRAGRWFTNLGMTRLGGRCDQRLDLQHAITHKVALWRGRTLRWVLVTPDMHRVHHSVIRAEHDRNYGFALSVWDRIFRICRAQLGARVREVGLEWQDEKPAKLGWSLWLPFR